MPIALGWIDATPAGKRQIGGALALLRTEITRNDAHSPLVTVISDVAWLVGCDDYAGAWAVFEPLHKMLKGRS